MKEGDLELLNEMAKFEDSYNMEKEYKIGWGGRLWRARKAAVIRCPGIGN